MLPGPNRKPPLLGYLCTPPHLSQLTHVFRDTFCSHPAKSCVQHLSTTGTVIPEITYAFSPFLETATGLPQPNVTCLDNATLVVLGLVSDPGMLYEIIGRAQATTSNGSVSIQCKSAPSSNPTDGSSNATVTVSGASAAWFSWVGDTNYDMEAGDAAHKFTFQGPDPHVTLLTELQGTSAPTYQSLLSSHTSDYSSFVSTFQLSLGQVPDLSVPTDQLRAAYKTDEGDVYLEWLLFNLGRYMLASSSRGLLPANLQGKWLSDYSGPWSSGQ